MPALFFHVVSAPLVVCVADTSVHVQALILLCVLYVICDFTREFLSFACVGVCNKTLTNLFCFYQHVCLRRGNDSCSTTDREGCLHGGGREGS